MAKQKHYIYVTGHYQCLKCDFFCDTCGEILGHIASEHIKKKHKTKHHKKEIPNLLPIKGVHDGRFIP